MGNMLPCFVQSRTTTLPPMNSKHWSHSIKLLARSLHSKKRRRCSKAKATREASSSPSISAAAAHRRSKPSSMATPRRAHKKHGVVRIKVVLTRKEAARLLSLTATGERTAPQVTRELRSIHAGRRANAAAPAAWLPVLESIPEE